MKATQEFFVVFLQLLCKSEITPKMSARKHLWINYLGQEMESYLRNSGAHSLLSLTPN